MQHAQSHLSRILSSDPGVAPSYRHGPKMFESAPPLEPPKSLLKWYGLHAAGQPIPGEISLLARRRLISDPPAAPGLGFVILHRCGGDFYFLIVCTWRNSNELWETVLYKDGDAMKGFDVFPREAGHLPTFCVWELAPVVRERTHGSGFSARPGTRPPGARGWPIARAAGADSGAGNFLPRERPRAKCLPSTDFAGKRIVFRSLEGKG